MSFLQMKPIFLPKKEVKQNNYDAAWKNQKPQFEREHGNLEKKSQFFSRVSQCFFSSQKKKKKKSSSLLFTLKPDYTAHALTLSERDRESLFWFFFLSLKTPKRKQSWKCQKPLHLPTHPPQIQLLLFQFRLSSSWIFASNFQILVGFFLLLLQLYSELNNTCHGVGVWFNRP